MPLAYRFSVWNMEMWQAFHDSGAWHTPTTKELMDVLDAYSDENKVGDIKVLVMNGNWDVIINTQGSLWLMDRLGWSGQREFKDKEFQPLPIGLGINGTWKATSDGRLAFLGMDGVGHYPWGAQSEGFHNIWQRWIHEGWQM